MLKADRLLPQLPPIKEKLPVMLGARRLSDIPWLLVRVTVFGADVVVISWLENFRIVGETVTSEEPVPLRLTCCGLLLALSFTINVALSGPKALGVNAR